MLFIMLCMLVPAVSMTGKAASAKTQVQKSVNTFFKYTKNLKTAKMEKCFVTQEEGKIFQDPAAFYKILRPYTKQMTWKIKKCKVNGKKATVTLRVDYQNLYISYWNMLDKVVEYVTTDFDASINSMQKYMVKLMKKEVAKNGSESYAYKNLKIKLQEVNGSWKITEPTEKLLDVIYCGYVQVFYEYFLEYLLEKIQ